MKKVLVGFAVAAGISTLAACGASAPQAKAHDPSYTKGSQHISLSATCPTNGTTVTKISGSSIQFAARALGKGGTWYQGPAGYSSSAEHVQATQVPVKGHGVRVYWSPPYAAQNYTFC